MVGPDVKQRLVDEFTRTLDRALADASAPDLDLPGLPDRPSPEQLASIEARNAARVAKARAAVYGTAWTRDQVKDRLAVHSNSITNWLAKDKVLALDGPEGARFPAWQFDLDADKPLLPGISDVAAAWPGGVVSLSQWMVAPNPTLHGRRPLDLLRDGQAAHLAEVVTHLP